MDRIARERMVDTQVAARGVHDQRVLDAMREVTREAFVPAGSEEFAYEDSPLPIGEGQTISQPYVVALMLEAAALLPGDRVLEVGAGSGYAAAVMSRIAGTVYAIERHQSLADSARARLAHLGYDNVRIRVGDGSVGWREVGPFDAIIVAAGAPVTPPSLNEQLAIGGRLVIPVGADRSGQTLRRIVRRDQDSYHEQNLGWVRFVPLVGEQGWSDDGPVFASPPALIGAAAEPLPEIDDPDFAAVFDRFADRRVVLLGEASHGTREFYQARAAITRRLVAVHGFTIVAVEADWPDAAAVDRHVRRLAGGTAPAEPPFQRFPRWMWRNEEVAAFVEWLRAHNDAVGSPRTKAGFHGLDIYSMGASMSAVLAYLDRVDPEAAKLARERYGCLSPWQREPSAYGRAALVEGYGRCEEAVVAQCRDLLARRLEHDPDGEQLFDAAQNARLVASAERYYRVMYQGGAKAWNLRDSHMFETLERLLEARDTQARAVVWAHNSHIGDARHTEMGRSRDEHNIGQLCRERFGDACALIGFGTHEGTVAAASQWDGDMAIMRVIPSRPGSYERLCHESGRRSFLLDLGPSLPAGLREELEVQRLERYIGVIYRPESELASHYAEASLAGQYDAWVWFDRTSAVTPIGPETTHRDGSPTWPFGV